MIFIKSPSNDPYFNLALEEYLIKNKAEEIFMLWQNDRAVIVGKNQNTLAEINYEYVKENGIAVVRRLTGGGAVFHDMGNLNFSYLMNDTESLFSNFQKLAQPIIDTLASYGVQAEIGGRNDILINGRKFSGNAQAVINGRFLHHGTLLFHTDFTELSQSLVVNAEKIKGKGIKSVVSRVANLADYGDINLEEFSRLIAVGTPYELTSEDLAAAEKLKNKKYATWEWNYGYSPKYNYHNIKKHSGGTVEVFINVADGHMSDIKIYGDFFAVKNTEDIEKALIGLRHDKDSIKQALSQYDEGDYFYNITWDEIADVLFS